MYADYFGLDEAPFAITPDPRYLYLGRRHAEALAHLLYGIREGGGFVLLTGEVGTGKTTLTRCLLEELPEAVDVAVVLNPRLDVTEFLEAICLELGLPLPEDGGNRRLVDALNRYLLDAHAHGRRTVLIVDEAQNLSFEVLEQVRLLTNLETAKTKLLQILLIGQPELREVLARPELRQLAQRVTARYHLEPLDRDELDAYVAHRLAVAGARAPLFDAAALRAVWRHSAGIPRRVNILCDRALLGAWSDEARTVSPRLVRRAAREIDAPAVIRRSRRLGYAGLLLIAAAVAAVFWPAGWRFGFESAVAQAPAVAPLPEWLAAHAADAGTDTALATLFRAWDIAYVPNGPPACEQAAAAGLRCLHDRATWRAVLELDRPAVLELATDTGRYQLTLMGVAGERALLRAGRAERRVDAGELSRWWPGEFLALWRPPENVDLPLLPGARGSGVLRLREQLDAALGMAGEANADAAFYDEALAARVRRFQEIAGLRVDGIAGERTWLALAARLPGTGPALSQNGPVEQ